jgi:hypothetical protein
MVVCLLNKRVIILHLKNTFYHGWRPAWAKVQDLYQKLAEHGGSFT